jgi:protein gp37
MAIILKPDFNQVRIGKFLWNPCTGCTKISPGCDNCNSVNATARMKGKNVSQYADSFEPRYHSDLLFMPARWRHPRVVQVCSMSDLFHPDIPDCFIRQVFASMKMIPQHIYCVETKRPERAIEFSDVFKKFDKRLWLGVSVENQDYMNRIDVLHDIPAQVKYANFIPLLGPVSSFNAAGLSWVTVSGETGKGCRPMQEEWVEGIKDTCEADDITFYFDQWNGSLAKQYGRMYGGHVYPDSPSKRPTADHITQIMYG